jgi:myo-inositol catabolism protein IolC
MTAPAADPLYFLAFDHRGFLQRNILGEVGPPTPAQVARIADVKLLIFEGVLAAMTDVPAGRVGILVDEQFGAEVARRAREAGVTVSLPAERSDGRIFEFEYGDDFGEHILRADPDITKALVRYNVDADASENRTQAERLRVLSDWIRGHGRTLLIEVLVVPTPAQLASLGGDGARFEREARPELIRRAIVEFQDAGVEPAIWKLEGIEELDDARAVANTARAGGRDDVRCLVLGSGSETEQVDRWLRTAAAVDGYDGFAIGRSIWWGPVQRHLAGEQSRAAAAREIASGYLHFVDVYDAARRPRSARA